MIPAHEQANLVARREVSPVELCEAAIERIEKLDHRIGAFITVASEQALEAARSAESRAISGKLLGPLDGVPVGIKDIESTAGIRTTSGSRRTCIGSLSRLRKSMSLAPEYLKKLVLVFVEELPGFEFFVQQSRVYIAVPNLEEQFFDSQTGVHRHAITDFHTA